MDNNKRGNSSSSPIGHGKRAKLCVEVRECSPIELEHEVEFTSPRIQNGGENAGGIGGEGSMRMDVAEEDGEVAGTSGCQVSSIPLQEEVQYDSDVDVLESSFMNLSTHEEEDNDVEEEVVPPLEIHNYQDFCEAWYNDHLFTRFNLLMQEGADIYTSKIFPKLHSGQGGYYFCDWCKDDISEDIELDVECGCHRSIVLKTLVAELCLRDICWELYKKKYLNIQGRRNLQ